MFSPASMWAACWGPRLVASATQMCWTAGGPGDAASDRDTLRGPAALVAGERSPRDAPDLAVRATVRLKRNRGRCTWEPGQPHARGGLRGACTLSPARELRVEVVTLWPGRRVSPRLSLPCWRAGRALVPDGPWPALGGLVRWRAAVIPGWGGGVSIGRASPTGPGGGGRISRRRCRGPRRDSGAVASARSTDVLCALHRCPLHAPPMSSHGCPVPSTALRLQREPALRWGPGPPRGTPQPCVSPTRVGGGWVSKPPSSPGP